MFCQSFHGSSLAGHGFVHDVVLAGQVALGVGL